VVVEPVELGNGGVKGRDRLAMPAGRGGNGPDRLVRAAGRGAPDVSSERLGPCAADAASRVRDVLDRLSGAGDLRNCAMLIT
jgi:hypothetical protein